MSNQLIIALDNICSALNVGAIIRLAVGLGVDKIIFGGITPLPLNPKVTKTALIEERMYEWEHCCELLPVLANYREQGFQINALELDASGVPLGQAKINHHGVLVLGNEREGINPEILRVADQIIRVETTNKKASLNVAVAAGIATYTLLRKGVENG